MLKIWWASLVVGPVLRGGAAFGLFQFRFFFLSFKFFQNGAWMAGMIFRVDDALSTCSDTVFLSRFLGAIPNIRMCTAGCLILGL